MEAFRVMRRYRMILGGRKGGGGMRERAQEERLLIGSRDNSVTVIYKIKFIKQRAHLVGKLDGCKWLWFLHNGGEWLKKKELRIVGFLGSYGPIR